MGCQVLQMEIILMTVADDDNDCGGLTPIISSLIIGYIARGANCQ